MSRLTDVEMRLVVERLDVDDATQVARLYDEFDAVISQIAGVTFVTITLPAHDSMSRMVATKQLILRLERVGRLRVTDLDLDLVDESEIQRRTGFSRQRVNQYVNSERRADFPRPATLVGNRRAWSWPTVNRWLAENAPEIADPVDHLCVAEQRNISAWIVDRGTGTDATRTILAAEPGWVATAPPWQWSEGSFASARKIASWSPQHGALVERT